MTILNNAKIVCKDLKTLYSNNYKIFISIISGFMLVFLIRSVLALLDALFAIDEYPIQRILFMISSTCLIIGLEIGFTKIIFSALDAKKILIHNIFNSFHLLGKYFQGLLCFYGIVLISTIPAIFFLYFQSSGDFFSLLYYSMEDPYFQELVFSYFDLKNILIVVLLLFLPIMYVCLRLFLWSYFVIDQELSGYLAIKHSLKLTENKVSEILCYLFLILLFNLFGLLSIIGICFTIPLTYMFLCKYYRLLIVLDVSTLNKPVSLDETIPKKN